MAANTKGMSQTNNEGIQCQMTRSLFSTSREGMGRHTSMQVGRTTNVWKEQMRDRGNGMEGGGEGMSQPHGVATVNTQRMSLVNTEAQRVHAQLHTVNSPECKCMYAKCMPPKTCSSSSSTETVCHCLVVVAQMFIGRHNCFCCCMCVVMYVMMFKGRDREKGEK